VSIYNRSVLDVRLPRPRINSFFDLTLLDKQLLILQRLLIALALVQKRPEQVTFPNSPKKQSHASSLRMDVKYVQLDGSTYDQRMLA